MSARDYYRVTYCRPDGSMVSSTDSQDILDNDTEVNANQFKLYDDFTTELRISFTPRRYSHISRVHDVLTHDKRRADPDDSGVDVENNTLEDAGKDRDLLENEVMVDPWSSMDSYSPLTDSGPSASGECTPSSASEPRVPSPAPAPACDRPRPPRARDLTLDLEHAPRRPHFLDEDFTSKTNIECRIPKPHFLDSPSPDGIDERSDITNPNFLDDDVDGHEAQKKSGALPKRPAKPSTPSAPPAPDDDRPRPPRTSYRTALHYGLENAARSNERDKRASQLYRGTWPGEHDVWTGHDASSVRSFSSNGSADNPRPSSNLENKMECVCSLISLLSLSPENNADLSGPLLEMSRSVESCIAMRQAGCIPLLVQLIHSKVARETRDRAAKALRNIIHTQTDDKAGRREARVWRLLEQVREYCYILEDVVEARKDGKEVIEDENIKHPSQSVAALMKLSFDEEHRHVVCQLGGLQTLAALVSGDQAAHGSGTDDHTCLTMRKYAGMTLTNLTFGDGNNKSLLCSFKEFMLALVEQLESPNDDMRQVTAAVLRNLSWRADTSSKQVLREVGAVRGLTKAAMTCQKEATLKSVLSALWNLTAHCSMNKVALCSVDGALGFLVDMLSYDSPTKTLAIVENAGGIMRNVSSHIAVREDYRLILRERNCLSVLLQHLKSPSLTVVSNSCGTLWNLSARCPQDQQFLWDHGAVPMLRSLIHSKHKMIAMGSSAALKNLLNSKPGKTHIIALDTTARTMNLPALPTLGARKQKALEQELDQNLAETCDNIEPATSPTTSNREEKNLFTATERQIAMNLERHRMTSSSPLMGNLASQVSLSHSAHLAGYLSCSSTLLKGALVTRSTNGSSSNVNRSDSKDSVTSTHSDSVLEKAMRTGKVPVPTPRSKDFMKTENNDTSKSGTSKNYIRNPSQPPVPPPRSSTDMRTNYTESGYDVDQDSCDQPIDFSRKYSETKTEVDPEKKTEQKKYLKKESETFGDYQETDLDQPTDYSLRYAEHHSETGSDMSEPPGPSFLEDTVKHYADEGTPYETPIIFSTATSMSDLRVIDKDKPKSAQIKENPEIMTHSDEKDTCSIEDPPRHDNDRAIVTPQNPPEPERRGLFDTKLSSGMVSPEKPVNYCDEGTPGCFSRVSSLSSLGEPTEEQSLAKRNARASIAAGAGASPPHLHRGGSSAKDKEGCKAVTFARSPEPEPGPEPPEPPSGFVEDTPLMFSRSSSLGSLPDCPDGPDDHGSEHSEVSRLTSGCISPSEIPDSPGALRSAPLSPRARPQPRSAAGASTGPASPSVSPPAGAECEREGEPPGSVFAERPARFRTEHTPAPLSGATSLSSLTIDDPPPAATPLPAPKQGGQALQSPTPQRPPAPTAPAPPLPPPAAREPPTPQGTQTSGDCCTVYLTEDTPALLSGAESRGDLSPLPLTAPPTPRAPPALRAPPDHSPDQSHDHSDDSSNLSDSAALLEQCIQKGIDQVVKHKGPPSEAEADETTAGLYGNGFYRSLPPHLRSSTETVRGREWASAPAPAPADSPPAPPLPPRAPLRPAADTADGSKPAPRAPAWPRPPPPAPALALADSLSSLSADSFGSTDREIFEETVQAGLGASHAAHAARGKTHSAERPAAAGEPHALTRHNKSLDRTHRRSEREFRSLAASYGITASKRQDFPALARPPFPYHGEASGSARRAGRGAEDGPPSLPARVDERRLERSNSLSSLSNDSFGSTDKEVFERSVRIGMCKAQARERERERPGAGDGKLRGRVRSDDRLEARERECRRRRRDRPAPAPQGALGRMLGEEYSRDRAILEEVIAKGAGDKCPKNVPAPPAGRAAAGGAGSPARGTTTGSEQEPALEGSGLNSTLDTPNPNESFDVPIFDRSNELPTVDSANTTLDSTADVTEMERSNECLAHKSLNTTVESEAKDELNRSNESYADVLDGSWSDGDGDGDGEGGGREPRRYEVATLTRRSNRLEWTDINFDKPLVAEDGSKKSGTDTWNDNTVPDDVTFPTISGSVHMVSSLRSEVADAGMALPDLLEKSDIINMSFSRPDLTNRLDGEQSETSILQITEPSRSDRALENVQEPSFMSLAEDGEPKFDSILSAAIEKEAARLAAQLKTSQFGMENSVTSLTSLDLDNVKPPSNLGSLLSLSASGHWDDSSAQISRKSQKSRKKSLPVALMVKRALSNSYHQGSTEHLDSNPVSLLDNVKPPSDMEHMDMESSIISVASIVSEVAETKHKSPPVVFDLKQPVQDFPLCNTFNTVYHDLENVNPPSLFNEMTESTIENEQTTAQQVYEDCISTLNVITDIPSASGSENCTPLPSDVSSVESTPKRQRGSYLTPKEKRHVSKDRYQTYTISDADIVTENEILEVETEYMTWTKSESDRSEDYVTASSDMKSRRRANAKQRRMEDRARYQTQTVDIRSILIPDSSQSNDPQIESLKQRLAAKKTMKQKRVEDAERFRTRTLSEDIPPSPTFVTKDGNFENVETTTGYDSLSSNELNHQQILDERLRDDDVFSRDSGHNEDDFDLNFTHMQTYTRSFRNCLPPVESPTAADMCAVNNLKNIELTASYRRSLQNDKHHPSSSDFASYEDESTSRDVCETESDNEEPQSKPKPKIIKPESRDESLDSNESGDKDSEPKGIRGRKKATYVSPYRRNIPNGKTGAKEPVKLTPRPSASRLANPAKVTNTRAANKTPSKPSSANTSPKKSIPNKAPARTPALKPVATPPVAVQPLPLVRQGTFTKEEPSNPPRALPVTDKGAGPGGAARAAKPTTPTTPTTPAANKSPSRLPQPNRFSRPLTKAKSQQNTKQTKPPNSRRTSEASIKNSASSHSLQSNDSGKTVTLSRSRQGSTSSVNSNSNPHTHKAKSVESRIASLWKRVEQSKSRPGPRAPDRRVWIEGGEAPPKLVRSSTFEGQPQSAGLAPAPAPAPTAPAAASKQHTAIGMRASHIPSPRVRAGPSRTQPSSPKRTPAAHTARAATTGRVFTRRPLNGQT